MKNVERCKTQPGDLSETALRTKYQKCAIPIAVELADFHLAHLKRLLKEFDGDLLLPVLLAEIGHYNLRGIDLGPAGNTSNIDEIYALTNARPLCNTYSISQSLNLPRETIRRKVAKLISMGYLERKGKRGLGVTKLCAQHFEPAFNFESLTRFLATYERLSAFLSR